MIQKHRAICKGGEHVLRELSSPIILRKGVQGKTCELWHVFFLCLRVSFFLPIPKRAEHQNAHRQPKQPANKTSRYIAGVVHAQVHAACANGSDKNGEHNCVGNFHPSVWEIVPAYIDKKSIKRYAAHGVSTGKALCRYHYQMCTGWTLSANDVFNNDINRARACQNYCGLYREHPIVPAEIQVHGNR